MSEWMTAVLLLYLPITALVFMGCVACVGEARRWPRNDVVARHYARFAFAAPFWPLWLVFVAVRGLVRLARLAFGGAR